MVDRRRRSVIDNIVIKIDFDSRFTEINCGSTGIRSNHRAEYYGLLDDFAELLRSFLLRERFLNHSLTIINWEVKNYSQPEFDFGETLANKQHTQFKALGIDKCSADLLQRIAGSWDFQTGSLWILSCGKLLKDYIVEVTELVNNADFVPSFAEVVVATDDGLTLKWWNPFWSLSEFQEKLNFFVSEFAAARAEIRVSVEF